jgi:hypothetical protein
MRRKGSKVFSVGFHNHTNIELNSTNQKHWKTPFRRKNVVMISLRIRMSLPRIGKERTRVDSIRRDSILFPTIILGKMHRRVSQEGVCISKISHLKV